MKSFKHFYTMRLLTLLLWILPKAIEALKDSDKEKMKKAAGKVFSEEIAASINDFALVYNSAFDAWESDEAKK